MGRCDGVHCMNREVRNSVAINFNNILSDLCGLCGK